MSHSEALKHIWSCQIKHKISLMKPGIPLLIMLILIMMYSCEYHIDETTYFDYDQNPDAPEITVNLNLYTDTVVIKRNEDVTFQFTVENQKVHWVRYFIDDQLCDVVYSYFGRFSLPMVEELTKDSIFKLRIEVFTDVGNGSLADLLGMEGFLFGQDYIIVYDPDADLTSKIFNTQYLNDGLLVEWDIYEGMNFINYQIKKLCSPSHHLSSRTIVPCSKTWYVDHNYVGERIGYQINVTAGHELMAGNTVEIEPVLSDLNISQFADNQIRLYWNKPKYYFNAKGYKIFLSVDGNEYSEIGFNDIHDTVLIYTDVNFLNQLDLGMAVVPQFPNSVSSYCLLTSFSTFNSTIAGISSFDYIELLKSNTEYLLQVSDNQFNKLSKGTNEILFTHETELIESSFSESANGNYFLGLTDPYKALFYNPVSDEIRKISSFQIAGDIVAFDSGVAISDNGIGIFSYNEKLTLFDFINEETLTHYHHDINEINNILISTDAGYFMLSKGSTHYIYKFHDGSVSMINSFDCEDLIGFDPLETDNEFNSSNAYLTPGIDFSYSFNVVSAGLSLSYCIDFAGILKDGEGNTQYHISPYRYKNELKSNWSGLRLGFDISVSMTGIIQKIFHKKVK